MMWRKTVLLVSVSALAACANKSAAPVVYGSQPQWQGRIYNSADEIADERARVDARRVAQAERLQPVPSGAIETSAPAPLVRASASPTDVSRQRFDYDAEPVYLNNGARRAALAEITADEPAAPATSSNMVTVSAGDTVYAISRRTGATPQEIIAANGLKAPYMLEVGQRLVVPGASGVAPSTTSVTSVTTVSEPAGAAPKRSDRVHMVRAGDTLFSISRSTGVAVDAIARVNGLKQPYSLAVGDRLRIPGALSAPTMAEATPAQAQADALQPLTQPQAVSFNTPPKSPDEMFDWPVKGAIIGKYSKGGDAKRNDGINIAAPVGTPVRAAADGEVVYRGAELDGYGNLLLVKHDEGYVTAYAHNEAMLVRKGDRVRKGQVIAKVGQTGSATQPQLHFEIRQNLKAVDPMAFLDG